MNFSVPSYAISLSNSFLEAGKLISGRDMFNAALNANYLVGYGNVVIPFSYLIFNQISPIAPDTKYFFKAFLPIDQQANERYWSLYCYGPGPGAITGSFTVTSSLGSIMTTSFQTNGNLNTLFYEKVNCFAATLDAVDFSFQGFSIDNIIYPLGINCFNGPRNILNPLSQSQEIAVDLDSLRAREPVYSAPFFENESWGGLLRCIKYASTLTKSLYGVFENYQNNSTTVWGAAGFVATTNSYVDCYPTFGIPAPWIYGTPTSLTQSVKNATVRVWAAVSGSGNTGRMEFTSSVGSVGFNITSSTPGYYSATLPIPCLNPSISSSLYPETFVALTGNLTVRMIKTVISTPGMVKAWTVQIDETFLGA